MSEQVDVKIGLDLDDSKAKQKLEEFKNSAKSQDIKVKLDLDGIKSDSKKVSEGFKNAFKVSNTKDLEKLQKRLSELNKVIKENQKLSKVSSNGKESFGFKINTKTNIVKDVESISKDYKKALEQIKELESYGKDMKSALDGFNKNQANAFKKFQNESKSYDKYIANLTSDTMSKELKKAIEAKKRQMKLQSELSNLGVVKVNNDKIRNQKFDGTMAIGKNEKWTAMFAKSASEAKDLEDIARKIQPKITNSRKAVEENLKKLNDEERKLYDTVVKAMGDRPKFDKFNFEDSNMSYIKLMLESSMKDIDKMGLDFNRADDVIKGLDRYFTRLNQMQTEFNSKFAGNEGFKPMKLDILESINKENGDIKQLDSNNDLLEKALREREQILRSLSDVNKTGKEMKIDNGLDSTIKEYLNVVKKIESLNAEMHKAQTDKDSRIVNSLKEEMQLYQRKQLEIASNIRANNLLSDSVKKVILQEERLAQARTKTKNTKVDSSSIKQQEGELARLLGQLDKYHSKLNEIERSLGQMKKSKGFLDNDLLERTNNILRRTRESLNANGIESDFNKINSSISKISNNMKDLKFGNTLSKQEASFNVAYSNMQNRLEKFIHSIKGMSGADAVIERLVHDFNNIKCDNIERANHSLREFNNTLQRSKNEMKQSSGTGFFSNFGKEFKQNLFSYTAGDLLADGIRNITYGIKDAIFDLDNAYTELQKVLDKPLDAKGLKKMSREATQIAKDTAQSSADVIRTTADITQFAGISDVNKARKVAEQTMKLVNVTGMSQKDASKGVATLISAFKDEIKIGEKVTVGHGKNKKSVDQLTNAFDKLNFVGNKYAISSDGVVEALQAGGSVLSTTGVDLTHTIAMITSANKSLQDPRRVGNGLKTINNKLKGMKTNAKDGTLEMNKTAKSLKEVAGIDIWDDKKAGKIKDSNKILEEVAGKWGKLTDAQKAGLSEAIAGQEQSAVFQSLMKNFDEYNKIVKQFDEGQQFNSMKNENDQFVNSMAGQLNRLKETWLGIWNELGANQIFAGALKGLNVISDAIAKLVNALSDLGVLQPMVAGLVGLLAFKQVKGALDTAKGLKAIGDVIKGLGKGSREVETMGDVVASAMGTMGSSSTKAGREIAETGNVLTRTKGKVKDFGTNVSKFMSTPLGVFSGYAIGASVGVYAIAKAYDYFNETSAEQSKRTGDLVKKREEEVNQYGKQIKSLQDIQKEYDKLSGKQNKSKDDLNRLKELNNEIAKIKPDLVVGKDADGNAIIAMTGNVKDLIGQLKEAQKEKKLLLSDSAGKDSESQVRARQNKKEVGGLEGGSQRMGVTNNLNDLQKLQEAQILHNTKMDNLEKQRNDAMSKAYSSSGKQRQKYIDEYNKANISMIKEQEKFSTDYNKQLNVVKETSAKLGTSIFKEIENKANFGTLAPKIQKEFSGLKKELDFSDIQSDAQLGRAKDTLNQLMESARNGKVDLGSLKKSLSDANVEFKRTGDVDAYKSKIKELVDTISEDTGIEDKNMLRDMFEGLNDGAKKGKTEMDKFLNSYNKSASDLANNDSFAVALATQKQHIESGIESLQTALDSKDIEVKKQVILNLQNDKDIPTQIRDFISKMYKEGANENDILEVTQQLMLDLKDDGKIDITKANKMIEQKFGKGKFKISPEVNLSENAKIAGVETVIDQLKKKFDEVPKTVTTVIKTEGITSFNQAKELKEAYDRIPKEVRTDLKNNGLETSQSIHTVDSMLRNLPPEVVSKIVNNFPDAVAKSKSYDDILKNLPPEVVTDILVNGDVTTAEVIKKAIETLPMNKDVTISVISGLASGNIDQVKNALSTLPPEKQMEVIANIQNALQGINTVEGKELKDKLVALLADPNLALQGIGTVNNTQMTPKTTKVNQTGAEQVQGKLNGINNTPNKHHQTKATQSGSENVKRLLDAIMKIKNKTHKTNAIKIGADNVLSVLQNIMNVPNSKRITVTTVFNTIGKAVSAVGKFITGEGNVVKDSKIVRNVAQELNVEDAPSPIPQGITTGTTSTTNTVGVNSPAPVSTGGSVAPSSSPVPSGVSTGATTQANGINSGQIMPAFDFDINLLSGMENNLKKIASQLDIVNTKMKNAFGNEKTRLLEEQNRLYAEQRFMQEELYKSLSKQQSALKSHIQGFGIWFDKDRIVNDVDVLLEKERQVKNLEKQVNADKEGKNEGLRKQYESQKESLDKLKKAISEYNTITFDKLPQTKEQWEKIQSQIKETNVEILKAKYELSNLKVDIQIEKFDTAVKRVSSQIAILNQEIENAFGKNKSRLLNDKIDLLRVQQDEVRNLSKQYEQQSKIQSDMLKQQGFIIDGNNQIVNPERLQDFAGTEMYSYLKEQLNSYDDLVNDKIPKLSVDVWNLQGEIKKAYEEEIRATAEAQDKISDVYKKQIEDRKKLIDEESKSRIDAINKEKDAYNKSRKEIDYKNDIDEQKKAINELQRQIDNASRDTSISGQKKLKELTKEMDELNKKLQDSVQQKIDEQVNENFDKEADRIQEDADREKKILDEKYSEENIQKLVNEALKTGVFVDIDGNVKDLESVMIAFVNSTKDGMGALGGIIKNDLISNIELAKSSLTNLGDIYSNLGMDRFFNNTEIIPKNATTTNSTKNVTVQFNQPLVKADTITKDAVPDIQALIKQAQKEIVEGIVKSM